jgi:Rubisco LSMT substrate-binding
MSTRLATGTNYSAYEIPYSGKIPEDMCEFCWVMTRESFMEYNIRAYEGKSAELKALVLKVLSARMNKYDTTIDDDLKLLQNEPPLRHRMAISVRLGEKQILQKAIERVSTWTYPSAAKRLKT